MAKKECLQWIQHDLLGKLRCCKLFWISLDSKCQHRSLWVKETNKKLFQLWSASCSFLLRLISETSFQLKTMKVIEDERLLFILLYEVALQVRELQDIGLHSSSFERWDSMQLHSSYSLCFENSCLKCLLTFDFYFCLLTAVSAFLFQTLSFAVSVSVLDMMALNQKLFKKLIY